MQLEYNPDEILTKEYTEAEVRNYTGSFCGFVLLRNAGYDLQALTNRLQCQWEIAPLVFGDMEQSVPMSDVMLDVPGAMVTVSLMEGPVPDGEAEVAASHAVWHKAKEMVHQHKAHLMIAVLPNEMTAVEAGKLYCKIVSAASDDDNALAVYTSGTIMEPIQFRQTTMHTTHDSIPLDNLVFVGTYTQGDTNGGYTVGMDAFGKDELEIVQSCEAEETIYGVLHEATRMILAEEQPAQWYLTMLIEDAIWEGRRKDGVMVEGHSIQLKRM